MKRRQGQSQVLSLDEIKRLIQFQKNSRHSTRNICLINLSAFTGMRVGEVSKLKLNDVVDENWNIKDQVVLKKEYTKTKKNRVVYLVHKEVRKSLENYLTDRRKTETIKENRNWIKKPLFVSQKSGAFSPRTLQRLYKNMIRAVGLDEMKSSHSFRRTFITNLISSGIDMKTVSTLAGHSSIQTTVDTYAVANPNKMVNVCKNISFQQ
jgi:integrase/recombinase XerD